jgi:hypothetical protein
MPHSILIGQSAWKQLGTVLTHRAWPLATVPQATPAAYSFYPQGKAQRIAANIAKFAQAAVISYPAKMYRSVRPHRDARNNTKQF